MCYKSLGVGTCTIFRNRLMNLSYQYLELFFFEKRANDYTQNNPLHRLYRDKYHEGVTVMSENKRIIRVKDLVIQADNIYIEPNRPRDPFFGGLRREEEQLESSNHESESQHHDERDRGPFSWI